MDFRCEYREGLGWWAENGSVALILRQGENPALLNVQSNDIAADAAKLLRDARVQSLDDEPQQFERSISQRLQTACGLQLLLCQILDEDEADL